MVSASIVLFNPNIKILKETIASFLKINLEKKLYLIDNSPNRLSLEVYNHNDVEYIFIGKNIGFARGHNIVLNELISTYHIILNPDVIFNEKIISHLIGEFVSDNNLVCVAPKVRYPNNDEQYTCRKFPTLLDYVNRVLQFSKNRYENHEYKNLSLEEPFFPDWVHGCFLLFKTKDFQSIKGFDSRYFLYMEDVDLGKKIKKYGGKIKYVPHVEIIHHHQRGSRKNVKLGLFHLHSIFKYFLKWGL